MSPSGDHDWLRQGSTSSDTVRDLYDGWAGSYDETLAGWAYRAPAEAAALLREAVDPGASLLDAGCGTGLAGQALQAAGFTGPVDGIDLSPESLKQAARRGIYRRLTEGNLQALPLPLGEDSYDGLICVGVLTYIPDSAAVLREFVRITRPGGRILVTQREDVFRERDDKAAIAALVGTVRDVAITDPRPYLPGNPDFGTEIGVIYAGMTVR